MMSRSVRVHLRGFALLLLLAPILWIPSVASAAGTCGTSDGHTLCVTVPAGSLSGAVQVAVTNASNTGNVIATWVPSGKSAISLITKAKPSPETGDYSFVWPTQK